MPVVPPVMRASLPCSADMTVLPCDVFDRAVQKRALSWTERSRTAQKKGSNENGDRDPRGLVERLAIGASARRDVDAEDLGQEVARERARLEAGGQLAVAAGLLEPAVERVLDRAAVHVEARAHVVVAGAALGARGDQHAAAAAVGDAV